MGCLALRGRVDRLAEQLDANPDLKKQLFPELDFGSTGGRRLLLQGTTLLHVAAEYGSLESAKLLLARGASVNARASLDEAGLGGQTPIFHAASQSDNTGFETVELLLQNGADLSVRVKLPGHYERPDELSGMHCSRICSAISRLGVSRIQREDGAVATGEWGHRVMPCHLTIKLAIVLFLTTEASQAQERVSFPTQDGGLVFGDLYGKGDHGVVLAHGGGLAKESWEKQARTLVAAGFRALAIDFRGEGRSHGGIKGPAADEGRYLDILAATHYLRNSGTKLVSVVGASMGGDYAAEAAQADPDEIDSLVLLAAGAYTPLTRMKGRKLFILARDDANADGPRLPKIGAQYEKALEPKKLIILEGSAHAQFLFQTNQGDRLMREILRFIQGHN